jgi:hypothetical protein
MAAFKESHNRAINSPFRNNMRCISHIINLVAQDILSELNSDNTILNSKLLFNLFYLLTILYKTNLTIDIITRLRRISTLIRFTTENRKLLEEGIAKYSSSNLLSSKRKFIPYGMYFIYLINYIILYYNTNPILDTSTR